MNEMRSMIMAMAFPILMMVVRMLSFMMGNSLFYRFVVMMRYKSMQHHQGISEYQMAQYEMFQAHGKQR